MDNWMIISTCIVGWSIGELMAWYGRKCIRDAIPPLVECLYCGQMFPQRKNKLACKKCDDSGGWGSL